MRDFERLARLLGALRIDPQARVFYDLFADALVWSDEIPAKESADCVGFSPAELRGVWRYRTSLILGEPNDRHRGAWELALASFPDWPGFDPRRRSSTWTSTYAQLRDVANERLMELEIAQGARPEDRPVRATA